MPQQLMFPMAAHVLLTTLLYVLLTIARAPAVWGLGRRPDGSSPWAGSEARISANLSNQFEWPVFFHVACLLLLQLSAVGAMAVGLAWVFIGGRLLHSCVQIFSTDIRLRGLIFTINFLAVPGLWILLLASTQS
jgi:hypothetical protein